MRTLEPRQLEGVIAHELCHIANKDVIVMTVAGFLATVAGLLVRFGVYSGMMGGRSRDNSAMIFMVVIVASIVVYVLSFLLLRALSRYREFAADRGAAIMTGAPAQLAAALATISGTMTRIPTTDLRAAEGMNAFFIIPAVAKGFSLSSIVSTHPPVEKRIERLMAMQATLDASPDRHALAPPPPWASSTSCADSGRPGAPTSTASSRSGRPRSPSRCRSSSAPPGARASASSRSRRASSTSWCATSRSC